MTFARNTLISIRSGKLDLQGVINAPLDAPRNAPGVVVCHPHPQFGGDMNNGVISKIATYLQIKNIVALRFNFRGVGESNGTYDNGKGELDDLKASLRFLSNYPGVNKQRIGVAGYSFGAGVALYGSPELKSVKAFAFVSPPRTILENQIKLPKRVPLLFVSGSNDANTPADLLTQQLNNIRGETQLEIVNGATHFWPGQEEDAAKIVAEFFHEKLI